jgi:hypothetical protein
VDGVTGAAAVSDLNVDAVVLQVRIGMVVPL